MSAFCHQKCHQDVKGTSRTEKCQLKVNSQGDLGICDSEEIIRFGAQLIRAYAKN